jgi:hypothetical protein
VENESLVCTAVCTSEDEPERADFVKALAAATLALTPEDRALLATMQRKPTPRIRSAATLHWQNGELPMD